MRGRVVTIDAAGTVLDNATVWVAGSTIAAITARGQPPPSDFAGTGVIDTKGTICPGLIDLHNHLSYNALPLWEVPKRFTNRDQWSGQAPDYRRLVSGPMFVLGRTKPYPPAIARYVEAKCLLGGVTTTQGIALYSNAGITRYYRGLVRNVERTDPADRADLPEALSRIPDVDARDIEKFFTRLRKTHCLLLHLSEGTDDHAHRAFERLHMPSGEWAIAPSLAGIHCVGLKPDDFARLKQGGASMVWSPLSNLLLYAQTADVRAAKSHGVTVGLGCDWSTSGSKNLLEELKVARLVGEQQSGMFSDRELVSMVTINAAQILRWEKAVGSIEVGKRADLLVIGAATADPYKDIVLATESDVRLVVIDGVPRYGVDALMGDLGIADAGSGIEVRTVGSKRRVLNLHQDDVDPLVAGLSLEAAEDRLRDGLQRLPELAADLEKPSVTDFAPDEWLLVLDHDDPPGSAQRLQLPVDSPHGAVTAAAGGAPLSKILGPLKLDPLTVIDDGGLARNFAQQANLPAFLKEGLPALY